MPIIDVGSNKNKEVIFGDGDVTIYAGNLEKTPSVGTLTINNKEKNQSGKAITYDPPLKQAYGETSVRMIFKNIECVDAVIRQLRQVKKYMMES